MEIFACWTSWKGSSVTVPASIPRRWLSGSLTARLPKNGRTQSNARKQVFPRASASLLAVSSSTSPREVTTPLHPLLWHLLSRFGRRNHPPGRPPRPDPRNNGRSASRAKPSRLHLLVNVLHRWLEQNHWDGPVGAGLIEAVSRVRRGDPRPPGLSLVGVGGAGPNGPFLRPHLNNGSRFADEVAVPVRIPGSPSPRRDHHQRVAVTIASMKIAA
jgi:hypothetical protein